MATFHIKYTKYPEGRNQGCCRPKGTFALIRHKSSLKLRSPLCCAVYQTVHSYPGTDRISILQTLLCPLILPLVHIHKLYNLHVLGELGLWIITFVFNQNDCQKLMIMVGHYQDPDIKSCNLSY